MRPLAIRTSAQGCAGKPPQPGDGATGRFTTPEEVATLITMLGSERIANVTGVNYIIDGGLIKTT
jgi:NAD(P)-dependent dehydrogenase (short-subunit alcohol dehydrogenase family)